MRRTVKEEGSVVEVGCGGARRQATQSTLPGNLICRGPNFLNGLLGKKLGPKGV